MFRLAAFSFLFLGYTALSALAHTDYRANFVCLENKNVCLINGIENKNAADDLKKQRNDFIGAQLASVNI